MDFERSRKPNLNIDMAPLIDVVFLLLLFFMLTSTYLQNEAIDLSLPSSSTATTRSNPRELTVSIARSGTLTVNGQAVEKNSLVSTIRNLLDADKDNPVALKSDREVPVQLLVGVMDDLRSAGATNIALMTDGAAKP